VKAGLGIQVRLSECDLVMIGKEVVEEFSLLHGDRFILSSGKTLKGHWDCDGIRRILENLLSNAVKYGESGKSITVTLKQEDETALMEVHNFGNAIAPDQLENLFDAYVRVENSREIAGWGLGLSLVKGLTEAHGGEVSVKSSDTEGTTFQVRLPVTKSI
jgi:signal transduction histidine kinase